MNITIDQFLNGLESSIEELPGVLGGWADLDEELQFEYSSSLSWMIRSFGDIVARGAAENRLVEVATRLARVTVQLLNYQALIESLMGISSSEIMPLTLARSDDGNGPRSGSPPALAA